MANKEKLAQITEQLEQGVKEVFTSDKFKNYLTVMSRFHHYSFQNSLLIALQMPTASHVAGYAAWKTKFNRQVMKGQKAISILAPSFRSIEKEVVLEDGTKELKEEKYISGFFPVSVFDISQTSGEELPSLSKKLVGDVENYQELIDKLLKISPVPVTFEPISGSANGYFSPAEEKIVVKEGMSEMHTIKTLVHEISHSLLHCKGGEEEKTDRQTAEVEAESTAYTVLQFLGMDSSDYSFGYIAGWAGNKEVEQLKKSLDIIRRTANTIIDGLEAA